MKATLIRLSLLAAVAALPAAAQTTTPTTPDRTRAPDAMEGTVRPGLTPPAANAVQGNEPRSGSMRTGTPDQGVTAGQGLTPQRTDSSTGTAASSTRGAEGGRDAVRMDDGTRLGGLESGANSFTEGQARSRIEAAGFSGIEGLQKDGNGIWRGRAMHGGRQVEVGLDYRGNVSPLVR
jgi:hypothetical protein